MKTILNTAQIKSLLPHRYPFLLVDKVMQAEDGQVIGIKNVSANEEFFQGHFPMEPIMPGVLIIEALAQFSGLILLSKEPFVTSDALYFVGIKQASFKKKVVPGDVLCMYSVLERTLTQMCFFKTYAEVEGEVVATADIIVTI